MSQLVIGLSLVTQGAGQFTGTATYVRELLREFGRMAESLQVQVLCNEHAFVSLAHCASANVVLTPATGQRVGASRVARIVTLAGSSLSSRNLARQFRPEVCVVHYPLTLGMPVVQLPTVLSLHDVQHHDLPQHFSPAERLWRRVYYDGPARRATLVHTLSAHSKSRIVDRLGIDPERVVVIPLAVDHQRFRPTAGVCDEEHVARLKLPPRFLFYPATLWPHKNHMALLDALALTEDEEVHLVLCGAEYGRLPAVLDAASKRGLSHRVRHLGILPDDALPAVYRRATAVVFPSTYEGFGTPPLEAMASGCPVASTLVGSLAEVCGDAVAELAPQDPRQMADVIDRLVGDAACRARLRASGLERSRGFAWSRVAAAHLAAYTRATRARD